MFPPSLPNVRGGTLACRPGRGSAARQRSGKDGHVTILVADDDPLTRRLLAASLERLGHVVVSVGNGCQALDALLAADGPRLAILDWMMPGLDGLAVCRAVRQRATPYVYVLLLTSRDRQEDLVEAFDAEVDDFLAKPFEWTELQARLRSGERLLRLQAALLETQERLRYEATHDHLTGLENRAVILEHLRSELSRARRSRKPVTVALADLDHFKSINDRYGHSVGDTVLRLSAGRMRAALRQYDTIGRYGGEEFLMVLPGCDAEDARHVAERVRMALTGLGPSIEVPCAISVSLGLASTGGGAMACEALVELADAALYRAKSEGRNRVAA